MALTAIVPQTVNRAEIVSLTERLGRLQLLRVVFVFVSVTGAALGFDVAETVQRQLWMASGAYLLAVAVTEFVRRHASRSSLATLATMLLVDGLYLGWVTYATGGTQSPLRFLLYVHLIAVTLLASYRTGLKIALWHSLLSIVALYAQAAALLPARESVPGVLPGPRVGLTALPVFNLTAFWLVALITAAFSSLNERELRRRRADFEALATMATEMEELQGPAEIAEKLLQWLGAGFGLGRAVVLGGRERVAVLAARGAEALDSPPEMLDRIVHEAWARRGPVLAKGLDPETNPTLDKLLPRARRVLVLPLVAESQPLGAVAIEHKEGRGWLIERRVVTVATQLVAYAALALRNRWLLKEMQRMADTDSLTGVSNRRMFDRALARELARARREHGSVSLLLLDIDHFKCFNDSHGHQAGDEALRGVAAALLGETRQVDLVARYGGEEFAAILPGCPPGESLQIAERILNSARELRAAAPITVSIGAATFPQDAADLEGLLRAADEALYSSKRAGRDRVSRGTPTIAPTPLAA
jgi:diguanylate cyclase (GGDEF)-like protein